MANQYTKRKKKKFNRFIININYDKLLLEAMNEES